MIPAIEKQPENTRFKLHTVTIEDQVTDRRKDYSTRTPIMDEIIREGDEMGIKPVKLMTTYHHAIIFYDAVNSYRREETEDFDGQQEAYAHSMMRDHLYFKD